MTDHEGITPDPGDQDPHFMPASPEEMASIIGNAERLVGDLVGEVAPIRVIEHGEGIGVGLVNHYLAVQVDDTEIQKLSAEDAVRYWEQQGRFNTSDLEERQLTIDHFINHYDAIKLGIDTAEIEFVLLVAANGHVDYEYYDNEEDSRSEARGDHTPGPYDVKDAQLLLVVNILDLLTSPVDATYNQAAIYGLIGGFLNVGIQLAEQTGDIAKPPQAETIQLFREKALAIIARDQITLEQKLDIVTDDGEEILIAKSQPVEPGPTDPNKPFLEVEFTERAPADSRFDMVKCKFVLNNDNSTSYHEVELHDILGLQKRYNQSDQAGGESLTEDEELDLKTKYAENRIREKQAEQDVKSGYHDPRSADAQKVIRLLAGIKK
jgi:hypothetical protein